MTEEKLKKATDLLKKIGNLQYTVDRLHNGHDIALCFYNDVSYGNNGYMHMLSLNEEQIKDIKVKLEHEIVKLKKEFEEL